MIIINTGNGKGKTTAAIGQIIRSLGQGFKVCLIQLFKGEEFYGEQKILINLENLDFFSFAKHHPLFVKNISSEQIKNSCGKAVEKLKELTAETAKKYDLIILDEFNIAVRDNFIEKKFFITLVKELSKKSDLFITGRAALDELIEIADLVTEMKEIKHPYNKGVQSKRGIEF